MFTVTILISQVQDMINEIDVDGSGFLEFQEFCLMLYKRTQDADVENDLKETFRVFSKDDEGCITAEELKFVLTHLPGKVTRSCKIAQKCSESLTDM